MSLRDLFRTFRMTREKLEKWQTGIYIVTIIVGVVVGLSWENSHALEVPLNL
ncbi:MAG: hypothetical protein KL787_11020 [Taibaiella sp.]|nr:hypothetical protein [Taibaiella sp.]